VFVVDAILAVAVIGSVAVLGYFSNILFEKTRIPDSIWLILFGLVVAWLGALPTSGLLVFAPVLAAIALAVMSFEYGLRADVSVFIRSLPRASLLALLNVSFAMVIVGLVAHAFLGLDIVRSLLLGAILGGVNFTPVSGLLAKVRMKDELKNFLYVEDVLSDTLSFIFAMIFISIYTLAGSADPVQTISYGFGIGIAVGLVLGVIKLYTSSLTKGKPYGYILTLGLAFLAYAVTEWFNGNGIIGAMVYGLLLGSAKKLPRQAGRLREFTASPFLKKFYSEISLFLRAFFLVTLGTIAVGTLNDTWIWGIAILVALIIVRIPAVELALVKKSATSQERWLMKSMLPKDLGAIVLVLIAASKGVAGFESLLGIVFIVIVGTVLYSTIVSYAVARDQVASKVVKDYKYEKLAERKAWKKYAN
jgi:cell volume regulation protein A